MMVIFLSAADTLENVKNLNMLDRSKISLILIISVIVIYTVLISIIFVRHNAQKRLWTNGGDYRSKEKLIDQLITRLYKIFNSFPPTREYTEKLSYHFKLISPCDSKEIAKNTVSIFLLTGSISIMLFVVVLVLSPNMSTLIYSGVAVVIVNTIIVSAISKTYQIKIFIEMQQLIENIIHNYHIDFRVDSALYLSMDTLSQSMKIVANQIYKLLFSENREIALIEYYENVPSKYLRGLVSLCVGVTERADEKIDGKYLFVRNLENIYSQLEIEIDKLQKIRLEFTGVMFVVVLPLFSLDIVKWFCIHMKESMSVFYYGKIGFIFDMLLLLVTVIIYTVMHKSAEYVSFHQSKHQWLYELDRIPFVNKSLDNFCDKNASKIEALKRKLKNNGFNIKPRHFILKSFFICFITFFISISIFNYLEYSNRKTLLSVDLNDVSSLTSAADDKQYAIMAETIEKYTKKYVLKDEEGYIEKVPDTQEEMQKILESEKIFYNKLINEAIAKDIITRVGKYQNSYFSFMDLFMCVLIAVFSYFIPLFLLYYNARVSKDVLEDEVNQFHSVIAMLKHDISITPLKVLIELEAYATILKPSLRTCINNIGGGDMEALNKLKEDEPNPLLCRIVDNLIRCDDMPMDEAFYEIDVERDGFIAKRKLANEKSIRKRVGRAFFLAAIPLIILFVYGILPTLVLTMKEISNMLTALDGTW